MDTQYERDVVAWAREQAALLRSGCFDRLDLPHIADEIESVGTSEQRDFARRLSVLLMHLLKWEFQPHKRTKSLELTLRNQRVAIGKRLKRTPSLAPLLRDAEWLEDVWSDALDLASHETAIPLEALPEQCPWDIQSAISLDWMP